MELQNKVNRITSLIEKFLEENMCQEEERELNEWLAEAKQNRIFFRRITNKKILRDKLKIYASANGEEIWNKTLKKLNGGEIINLKKTKTFKFPVVALARWLAAILPNK